PMRSVERLFLVLTFLLAALGSRVQAQTIKVTPNNTNVAVTKTVQYAAQVTGLASSDVIWSAGGVAGGNATAGTITPGGLYTAPSSLPAQNPVQIVARSVVNSKVSGLTYVNILAPGPQ